MKAIDIRGGLSGADLITLVSERGSQCDVHRRGETERVLMAGVQTQDRLGVLQFARENVLLVGNPRIVRGAECSVRSRRARGGETRSKRRIQRVLEIVLEAVVSEGATKIIRPARHHTTHTAR